MSRLQHLYISRPGDKDRIRENYASLMDISDEQLVENYNRQARLGIVGVHAQVLFLLAMNVQFMFRFGTSPLTIKDQVIIRFSGLIELQGDGFSYTELFEYGD
jgi:hypothetical protein